jgi:Ca-activated chloride channel family protein
MYSRFAIWVLSAVLAAPFLSPAQTVETKEPIRIETRLVSVPVVVGDRNGRYVPDLTAADFAVFQEGVQQKIDFFAAVEEPLTIALLIDTSQSTQPVLREIKDSARSLIKLLSPQDRAMIVAFDYDVHVLSELTSDQEQLRRAIKAASIPEFVGTRLRDAAWRAINRSFAGISGRKAVIVLTDGKDVDSRVSRDELIYSLQESDTLVYTVMFKTGFGRHLTMRERHFERYWRIRDGRNVRFPGREDPRRERAARMNERAIKSLQEMSETTGGRFYATDDGKMKKAFASIMEELRMQYRLGFYPPDEIGPERLYDLKVKVSRPDVVVRSRASYRVQQ